MKKVVSALSFALFIGAQVLAAHAQTNDFRAATPSTEQAAQPTPANGTNSQTNPAANLGSAPVTASATPLAQSGANSATGDAPGKVLTTVPGASGPSATAPQNSSTAAPVLKAPAPETIYRVGAGDVLDIRLLNAQTRESTLFTVMPGGLLEYPLAGEPLQVGGLTVEEINTRLTGKIKIYEKPQLLVSVRDYVSHSVMIAGLVGEPGKRVLRREAVPLYVVLAEAQPRPEAGRALILRPGDQNMTVDLADVKATAMLVFPGDVITLSALPPAPPQFFYVGGPVVVPGQKDFHPGLTLTQAVLAAGGVTRFAGSKVKISRQGTDGRLVSTEYNLKQIESGKVPDPVLQPGDRLEVSRGGW
ncbi:MAG TPA: polysaccharide biosynthesis/export family protein [Pyrinomonadaceae bacterium]